MPGESNYTEDQLKKMLTSRLGLELLYYARRAAERGPDAYDPYPENWPAAHEDHVATSEAIANELNARVPARAKPTQPTDG